MRKMKALILTSKGVEFAAALEIKELIGAESTVIEEGILFDFEKLEDLLVLCYKAQSVDKVLLVVNEFSCSEETFEEELEDVIDTKELGKWLKKGLKFKIGVRNASSSMDIIEKASSVVKGLPYGMGMDFKVPDIYFYVFFSNGKAYFCVDMTGTDLFKRSYRIFTHPQALRGTIGYGLLRFAGVGEKDVILDPFMGSGIIPIEAGFYLSGFPLNYYNKDRWAFLNYQPFSKFDFRKFFEKLDVIEEKKLDIYGSDYLLASLSMAKKNAKIGGVDKFIALTKMEAEWLDTKWEKGAVDKIVTHPPEFSKHQNPRTMEKLYDAFFFNAEYLLKNDGVVAVVVRDTSLLKKAASKHKFRLKEEKTVWSGQQELKFALFSRKT